MPLASDTFLQLRIEFDPRRVSIGFRNDNQAARYAGLISQRSFTQNMKLDPQQRGRFVSVRLPSRITQIEASTTYEGFYLFIEDAKFASQWHDALILWRFTSGSRHNLYVKRDMKNEDLNKLLHIRERRHKAPEPTVKFTNKR